MDGVITILMSILPPFLLLALGCFARKLKLLRSEADASLSMVTIRILYPAFILYHILGSDELIIDHTCLLTSIFGFFSILIGFGLAGIISRIAKMESDEKKSFQFCSGIFNYGFIAIPVAQSLFGPDIVVRVILFNLGVEIAIWTIGVLVLTKSKFSLRGILNPPAIAVFVGLLIHTWGGRPLVPTFIWEVITMTGQCSIPLGLMLIGGSFYDLIQNFRFSFRFKTELSSIAVRNFLFPLFILFFLSLNILPTGMYWMQKVLIVQAAMPAGIFAIVIVGNYSGDQVTAMRTILSTMLTSIVTLPFWLYTGMKLIN